MAYQQKIQTQIRLDDPKPKTFDAKYHKIMARYERMSHHKLPKDEKIHKPFSVLQKLERSVALPPFLRTHVFQLHFHDAEEITNDAEKKLTHEYPSLVIQDKSNVFLGTKKIAHPLWQENKLIWHSDHSDGTISFSPNLVKASGWVYFHANKRSFGVFAMASPVSTVETEVQDWAGKHPPFSQISFPDGTIGNSAILPPEPSSGWVTGPKLSWGQSAGQAVIDLQNPGDTGPVHYAGAAAFESGYSNFLSCSGFDAPPNYPKDFRIEYDWSTGTHFYGFMVIEGDWTPSGTPTIYKLWRMKPQSQLTNFNHVGEYVTSGAGHTIRVQPHFDGTVDVTYGGHKVVQPSVSQHSVAWKSVQTSPHIPHAAKISLEPLGHTGSVHLDGTEKMSLDVKRVAATADTGGMSVTFLQNMKWDVSAFSTLMQQNFAKLMYHFMTQEESDILNTPIYNFEDEVYLKDVVAHFSANKDMEELLQLYAKAFIGYNLTSFPDDGTAPTISTLDNYKLLDWIYNTMPSKSIYNELMQFLSDTTLLNFKVDSPTGSASLKDYLANQPSDETWGKKFVAFMSDPTQLSVINGQITDGTIADPLGTINRWISIATLLGSPADGRALANTFYLNIVLSFLENSLNFDDEDAKAYFLNFLNNMINQILQASDLTPEEEEGKEIVQKIKETTGLVVDIFEAVINASKAFDRSLSKLIASKLAARGWTEAKVEFGTKIMINVVRAALGIATIVIASTEWKTSSGWDKAEAVLGFFQGVTPLLFQSGIKISQVRQETANAVRNSQQQPNDGSNLLPQQQDAQAATRFEKFQSLEGSDMFDLISGPIFDIIGLVFAMHDFIAALEEDPGSHAAFVTFCALQTATQALLLTVHLFDIKIATTLDEASVQLSKTRLGYSGAILGILLIIFTIVKDELKPKEDSPIEKYVKQTVFDQFRFSNSNLLWFGCFQTFFDNKTLYLTGEITLNEKPGDTVPAQAEPAIWLRGGDDETRWRILKRDADSGETVPSGATAIFIQSHSKDGDRYLQGNQIAFDTSNDLSKWYLIPQSNADQVVIKNKNGQYLSLVASGTVYNVALVATQQVWTLWWSTWNKLENGTTCFIGNELADTYIYISQNTQKVNVLTTTMSPANASSGALWTLEKSETNWKIKTTFNGATLYLKSNPGESPTVSLVADASSATAWTFNQHTKLPGLYQVVDSANDLRLFVGGQLAAPTKMKYGTWFEFVTWGANVVKPKTGK